MMFKTDKQHDQDV